MSWSFTASGPARQAASNLKEQANAAIGSRSDAEKVVILSGVEAFDRIAGQYEGASASVSFYGHADQGSVSSYKLEVSVAPVPK